MNSEIFSYLTTRILANSLLGASLRLWLSKAYDEKRREPHTQGVQRAECVQQKVAFQKDHRVIKNH